jgi:hypothetical protein
VAPEQVLAFPDFSQAEQAGNFPSHFTFAMRHFEQAATGRLTLRTGLSKNEEVDILGSYILSRSVSSLREIDR